MKARKLSKTERKTINKLALAIFAEHLYVGLTIKKNYGLCEATRHWRAAKHDPLEYSFIELPTKAADIASIANFLVNHDLHVDNLERLLTELGTFHLSDDELEALAKQRGES